MTRLPSLASAVLTLLLTAGICIAADHAVWGQLKQHLTQTQHTPMPERTYLSFGSLAAAKKAPGRIAAHRTVSKWFKAGKQGSLKLVDNNGSGSKDNIKVALEIPRNAATEDVKITMTVYGDYLSELVVGFEPGGLAFLAEAQLEMRVGTDLLDVQFDGLTVYHEYSDGIVEGTTFNTHTQNTNYLIIQAAVPGFSRYGLRGSW